MKTNTTLRERFEEKFGEVFIENNPHASTDYYKTTEDILSFIETEVKQAVEKAIIIPKGSTHPKHDVCEDCVQGEKERIVEIVNNGIKDGEGTILAIQNAVRRDILQALQPTKDKIGHD